MVLSSFAVIAPPMRNRGWSIWDGRALRRRSIAENAVQSSTNESAPPFLGGHPGADLPGRIVADVLGVTALEIGDPVPLLVLVKANDPALHQRGPRRSM